MFKPIIIDGKVYPNYTINKEGQVKNKKGKILKQRGPSYYLYIDGKHQSHQIVELIKQAFANEGPTVDLTNPAFVQFSQMVREKLNKNINEEILTLKNPDLLAVDPFDSNLSDEVKEAIMVECKENPWYFFRRILFPANRIAINYASYALIKATIYRLNIHVTTSRMVNRKHLIRAGITYLNIIEKREICLFSMTKPENINDVLLTVPEWMDAYKKPELLSRIPASVDELKKPSNIASNVSYFIKDIECLDNFTKESLIAKDYYMRQSNLVSLSMLDVEKSPNVKPDMIMNYCASLTLEDLCNSNTFLNYKYRASDAKNLILELPPETLYSKQKVQEKLERYKKNFGNNRQQVQIEFWVNRYGAHLSEKNEKLVDAINHYGFLFEYLQKMPLHPWYEDMLNRFATQTKILTAGTLSTASNMGILAVYRKEMLADYRNIVNYQHFLLLVFGSSDLDFINDQLQRASYQYQMYDLLIEQDYYRLNKRKPLVPSIEGAMKYLFNLTSEEVAKFHLV